MRPRREKETVKSFEYQWKNIPTGLNLLSDSDFREKVPSYICEEFGRTDDWFKGKLVLDAGCGSGRWSYGFIQLGCHVVAMDATASGCASTHANVENADVIRADVFNIPLRPRLFDIVFSWGVLHHTGDTEKAFQSAAQMAKSGGLFHVYVYGPKSKRFIFWNKVISSLPLGARHLSVKMLTAIGKVAPSVWKKTGFTQSEHANFDAYAPTIADRTTFEEAVDWFGAAGFVQIERRYCAWDPKRLSTDIYLQAISP